MLTHQALAVTGTYHDPIFVKEPPCLDSRNSKLKPGSVWERHIRLHVGRLVGNNRRGPRARFLRAAVILGAL